VAHPNSLHPASKLDAKPTLSADLDPNAKPNLNLHDTRSSPTRVLILGGGFGGMYVAMSLEKLSRSTPLEVTLVSRDNYFTMTPLLFEAGSGILEPRHAVSPIRRMLRTSRFIEAEIETIDVDTRQVHIRQSGGEHRTLEFDHLVIALGGVTNHQIIPGSEQAMMFKTLADAIFLRNHVIDLFERAEIEPDEQRRRTMLRFVIVGAGLVGVEQMGEMTEFVHRLSELYPRVNRNEISFHLIEAGPRVLPELEEDLADHAKNTLEKRGVHVRLSTPVQRIDVDSVYLPNEERIESETIVLAAGVLPSPLLKDVALEKDRRGRLIVEQTMRVTNRPYVWALGDCAAIPDGKGGTYPPLAQHAIREARVLAKNIAATVKGGALQPFVYSSLGTLAALGHYDGVGRVMKVKLRGFLAWWVWRTYYLLQMPRWERRIRIVLDWTIGLLFKNDIVKLDLFGDQHPTSAPAAQRNNDSAHRS
jgi:NADH:ubiquinone reductase (H+-translocating)